VAVIRVAAPNGGGTSRLLDGVYQTLDRRDVSFRMVAIGDGSVAVGVVGDRLVETPNILGLVFASLGDVAVSLVSMGGSDRTLGFVVSEDELPGVVRRLHAELVEDATPPPAVA
jgi:aspartokinase